MGQKMSDKKLSVNSLKSLSSALIQRASWAGLMGKTYEHNRDLYQTLGYKRFLRFEDYWGVYRRQDIASRIVNAPVEASWRVSPSVVDDVEERTDGELTAFEQAVEDLGDRLRIWQYLARADKLARVGHYSVLLLGVNDGRDLAEPLDPVTESSQLVYLAPFRESNATIGDFIRDPANPKFGFPEYYTLRYSDDEVRVMKDPGRAHYTRVLHMTEGLLEDDVFGVPVLDGIFNRLQDLEKVTGGSAEMFWRNGRKEIAFEEMPDVDFSTGVQSDSDLQDEIDSFVHNMQNYIRLSGVTAKSIAPAVADPSPHIEKLVDIIAGAVGIPKRILLGSERGELASSQDETNFAQRIGERREQHVIPNLVRPFIDRLIELNILPEPESGSYTVSFETSESLGQKDAAEVARIKTEALARYSDSMGASSIVPPSVYLRDVLKLDESVAEKIEAQLMEDAFEEGKL